VVLAKVVSGGQTGSDQAGWRAAKAAGIPTGWWMPAGFRTEDGPRPEFAGLYGARETTSADYPGRTRANARDSDGTVWFGVADSPGARATLAACKVSRRPVFQVTDGITRPGDVADCLDEHGIRVLNVAGNRESTSPGTGARTEAFLGRVFALLKEG